MWPAPMADNRKKMPMSDSYACVVRMERSEKLKGKIVVIVVGFLLAAVSISVMTAFTYRSLREIRYLKEEIEILKQDRFSTEVLKHLKMEIDLLKLTVKKVVGIVQMNYEYDEYVEDGENPTELQYSEAGDYYDYESDPGSEDSENEGSDSEYISSPNDIILSDENLMTILNGGQIITKDLKDTRAFQRKKRNVEGYNEDTVPVNGESFPEQRRRNNTSKRHRHRHHQSTSPSTESGSQGLTPRAQMAGTLETTTKSIFSSEQGQENDIFRASRQVDEKSSLEQQQSSVENSDAEVVQTKRQTRWPRVKHRNLESLDETHPSTYPRTGRMKPLPTAHFDGDTSKYVLGQHTNFNGNGHLKHPSRTYVDWVEANWFKTLGMDRHFTLNDGVLTIKESGIYFVYAQIYYLDKHDTNGFRVYKNDDTFLQCTTMTHSVDVVMKGNTCYTAAANYLHEGDRIYLLDLSESRYSLFEPGKSFFGAIKLGDVRIK